MGSLGEGLGLLEVRGREMIFLDFATSRFGLPIIIILGFLIFYEGLPLGPLRNVPFVGHYLALVDGRVNRAREQAIVQARADFEAEARQRAMALIEKRSKDNAQISKLDAARLCAELGGHWVPNENRCD